MKTIPRNRAYPDITSPEFIGSTWIDKAARYAVIDVGGNLLGYWQYTKGGET